VTVAVFALVLVAAAVAVGIWAALAGNSGVFGRLTGLVGVCILALFLANTINAGADLGAVAAGGALLTKGALHEIWLVVPVALLVLGLQLFMTYSVIFKVFKWLTMALFAYVITGIIVHPPALEVLRQRQSA